MYRVYNKQEAIRRVQDYLRVVGNPDIFVAPTGAYDDNTRLSVLDYQRNNGIEPTGEVDYITFQQLFREFSLKNSIKNLCSRIDSFISFPLMPGKSADGMIHINIAMARLLDYYGYTHRLRDSSFYSGESREAVKILRGIYMLPDKDMIDEVFYIRMVADHDSINKLF